ncbi:hypothetical protein [Streptomyces sp. NPDC049744]|uniref:hypothetical protein n=1 Tax=Streptomyces sp. NPDC049744 TaxID=3154359 RepID=UPI00342716E8
MSQISRCARGYRFSGVNEVRAYDLTMEGYQIFGPADRIEVLVDIGKQLVQVEAGSPLWPGNLPRSSRDASVGG